MTRVLEVRRHSYTKKGDARGIGSHLSVEGVRLVRKVGEAMGPFARVVVSDVPRTVETALAMGFAVDEVLSFGEDLDWDRVIAEIGSPSFWHIAEPFEHIATNLATWPEAYRMGDRYRREWVRLAMSIEDGQAALVVSHGQLMEIAVVSCMPHADRSAWGAPFSHCEGVRFEVVNGQFTRVEFLRVNPSTDACDKDRPRS